MSAGDMFHGACRSAFVDERGRVAASTMAERVAAIRHELDRHAAGRVVSQLDNGVDAVALDLAVRSLGAVHVPTPPYFSAAQTVHVLESCGAETLIAAAAPAGWRTVGTLAGSPVWQRVTPLDMPPMLPNRTACITYTSGTSGQPKGVCLAADTLLDVARALAAAMAPLDIRSHMCLLPLATLLEQVAGVYAPMLVGADIAVPGLASIGYTGASGLDVGKLVTCLHTYRPESIIVVPQLLLGLVSAAEHGVPLPDSLKMVAVGGARVGESLLARAHAVGLPVYEGYGLSECASVVALNAPGMRRPGSVGKPLAHTGVRIADDGEIFVSGPHLLGYVGSAPNHETEYATGDTGMLDDDGFLWIHGRKRDVFITSYGRNVNPSWVESELVQDPLIAQAVVFGEARAWNVAVILPRSANAAPDALAAAVERINQVLPDYARVHRYVLASEPFSSANGQLTTNGRPRRDAIASAYAEPLRALYSHPDGHPHDTP